MLAHVDVNSAYVSWERVFQPRLEGRAVAVVGNAFSLHLGSFRCISPVCRCTGCSETPMRLRSLRFPSGSISTRQAGRQGREPVGGIQVRPVDVATQITTRRRAPPGRSSRRSGPRCRRGPDNSARSLRLAPPTGVGPASPSTDRTHPNALALPLPSDPSSPRDEVRPLAPRRTLVRGPDPPQPTMNERAADDPGVLRFEEHLHVRIETFPRETVRIEKVIGLISAPSPSMCGVRSYGSPARPSLQTAPPLPQWHRARPCRS